MTDAAEQLDLFPGRRKPPQRMSFRDAGWRGTDGKPIALFQCGKCQRASGWIVCEQADWINGPLCPNCNRGK